MICPLSPAHLFALGAIQLYVLLLFFIPGAATVPLFLFLLLCFIAPLFPGCSFYLPVISRGKTKTNGVALTFDDGPDPQVTPRVLELLARHSVKATFFVTGRNAERYPDLIRAILAQGHSLGNHSYSHSPFLMMRSKKTIRREVEDAQNVLKPFGVYPMAFRPPVGITGGNLWRVLLDLGLFCVNFSCRAGDMGNRRIRDLAGRLLKKVRHGDIVLLHDVAPPKGSIDQLMGEFEALILGLKAKNLEIQPLARLLGKEIMQTSTAGMNATELFYDGLAPTYDEEQLCSTVSIARLTELNLFTARLPGIFQGAERVLEIGAGTGLFTMTMAQHCGAVDALDISERMLAQLKEKCRTQGVTNIHARLGDAESLELEGSYDVVCAFSALEYVKDLPGLLTRLHAHVKPGGTIYFLTARKSLFRFFTQLGNAMRQGLWLKAHSRRQFQTMLRKAGFEVVSIEAHLLKCIISGGMLLEVVARKPVQE